jgi:hypothetical protein
MIFELPRPGGGQRSSHPKLKKIPIPWHEENN